jgi:hypothetical protein
MKGWDEHAKLFGGLTNIPPLDQYLTASDRFSPPSYLSQGLMGG